jgi:hypothetical protein
MYVHDGFPYIYFHHLRAQQGVLIEAGKLGLD